MWELIGAGLAVGATGVWALAAAARVGALRAILDLFPRASWDAVTWVLIPALLLAPVAIQGVAVAAFAGRRPAAWGRAAAGAAAGSLLALAVFGAALLVGVRQLPRGGQVWLGRTAPEALILGFSGTVLAGWLTVVARLARTSWLRWAALPVAAALVAVAWIRAHHTVVALSYILDRPEANGFFAAVAVGGAVGSAWAARRGASDGD
ncbi:MAG: hypothetical protein ACYDAB_15020 [bacterium]